MGTKQNFICLFFLVFGQIVAFGMGGQAEPFTEGILKKFSVDQLKQADFFLKNELVLTRVVPHGVNIGVDGGTLTIVNGETIETIRIPTDVKGKLISVNKSKVVISFSPNHLNRTLLFSEELIGTEYFLVAGSTVKYGDYDYKVNRKPKLLVLFNDQFNRERTSETETGW